MVLPVLTTLLNEGGCRCGFEAALLLDSAGVTTTESEIHSPDLAGFEVALQVESCLASCLIRIDGIDLSIDQIAVKGIFHIGLLQWLVVQLQGVGFVLGEQPGAFFAATQAVGAESFNNTADEQMVLKV